MHRTTTTALLVTVAVAALSGCVTVQRPPVPDASAPAARLPGPFTDERAKPRIVQAPAREALEHISPSREAKPSVPAARRPAAPAPRRDRQPERPQRAPRPRSPHHEPPRPRADPPALPDHVHKDARGHTDACALGKKYGGWRQDSPEAVICRRTQ